MNKIILFFICILFTNNLFSQTINPDVKPEPLKSSEFKFPNYTVKTLSNGLKLFIIEDKEQPTIAFRLMIFGGSSVEGKKAGVAELAAGMLTKGTKTKDARKIASLMDGIGASLSASAGADNMTVYTEGLKKHQNLILETLSDIVINPTFPLDEFIKIQQQTIASVQYEKSNSGAVAQALARVAIYGKDHPYAKRKTEESLNTITVDDLKEYYSKWAKPGNASMAVVGDVKPDEIVKELEKYFKNWKTGKTDKIVLPEAKPMPKGIYFIKRPGSVQTALVVTTQTVPYNNVNYNNINMASQIFGGANGRIYQTLREKYSFTYSPYAFLSSTKYTNRFAAVADVATAKTDSSLMVVLNELKDLTENSPSKEELIRVKTSFIGNYNMSFENSLFIASLIQNEDFNGNQITELKNYTKKLESITPADITTAYRSYINPENVRIVVAGDPSIIPSIEKYGQIYNYDLDLNPISGADAKLEPVSISPEDLISKYENAIGGRSNIEKIQTINSASKAELSVNGQVFPGEVLSQKKAPNKLYNYSDFKVFTSQTWVDGENAWSSQNNQASVVQQGDAKERMMFEAEMFNIPTLKKHGFKLKVLGKQGNQILLWASHSQENELVFYFNFDNYLLEQTDLYMDGPEGVKEIWNITAGEYAEFGGVKFPQLQKTKTSVFTITLHSNYTVNAPIDDAVFKPQK